MRIEVFGNKALVSSAALATTPAGLHLLLNLTERWGNVHCQGGSTHYHPEGASQLDYDTFLVSSTAVDTHGEPCSEAEVVIISETEAESAQLKGALRYVAQEKEQYCVLYVPSAQLQDTALLAEHA